MHQRHAWFLSEAFVMLQFRGIFLWHSSLHISCAKLSKVTSCGFVFFKKKKRLKKFGVTICHFFGQRCVDVCIVYSDFMDSELFFSHTGLKF